jgi:hypothetical protein
LSELVKTFGARLDGRTDDSAALQRAIDFLRPPSAVPNAVEVHGGVLELPRCAIRLSRSVRIPTGVTLRGSGAGTVLLHDAPREDRGAIDFFSPFDNGYCTSAAVEDLCIHTNHGPGITVDPSVKNLNTCRLRNLIISAGAWGIDLRNVYSQNLQIENVHLRQLGAGAVWVRGNANQVLRVNTEAGTRPGFMAEPALLVVDGVGNLVQGCILEGVSEPVVAAQLSGQVLWRHNWIELGSARDRVALRLVDCVADMDYLQHFLPHNRLELRNSVAGLAIADTTGETVPVSECVLADVASFLKIGQAIVNADAGCFEDPRVCIGSVTSRQGGWSITLPPPGPAFVPSRWEFGEGARGRIREEPGRLVLRAPEDPAARLSVGFRVPADFSTPADAALVLRVDGPGEIGVWQESSRLACVATNTTTLTVVPSAKAGQLLRIDVLCKGSEHTLSRVRLIRLLTS